MRKQHIVPARGTKDNPTPLHVRFWSKVDKRGLEECWPWLGSVHARGYGQLWSGDYLESGAKQIIGAHVASLMVHGIPRNGFRCAMHRCNNKACVNPDHLSWGTHQQNALDAIRDGLVVPVKPQRPGMENAQAKLTDDEVRQIRKMAGFATQRDMADMYGVSNGLISLIVNRKRWAHLEAA